MPTNPRNKVISDHKSKKNICRQRIPESICTRKETIDIDILVTSRNGDRNMIPSIKITSGPPAIIR